MAKIIGVTHSDGRIVRVLKFTIGGSDVWTGSPQNDGILHCIMYKNSTMEEQYLSNTLDTDFEKVGTKIFTVNNVLDKLTQTPDGTVTDGERIWQLVYTFVKNQLGVGWDFEYEA